MNQNKEILNYCPNYFKIVNFDFVEEDNISDKLIKIYKTFIFNIDITNGEQVKKAQELDRVINVYIDDYDFRSQMQKEILNIRVKKDSNILMNIISYIFKIFTDYEEYTTRKIYIAKWI